MSYIRAGNTTTTTLIQAGDTTGNLVFTTGGANTAALTINNAQNLQLNAAGTKILNSSGNPILQQTGSILQVVNATTLVNTTSTTSTSFVTTTFSASITPTSSTSKILACFSGGNFDNNSTANQAIYVTFYRNSTNLGGSFGIAQVKTVTARILSSCAFCVLDSPTTTASTTYTLYIAGDGQLVYFNNSTGLLATITLMEIAA